MSDAEYCLAWFASRDMEAGIDPLTDKVVVRLSIDGSPETLEITDAEVGYRAMRYRAELASMYHNESVLKDTEGDDR